MSYMISEIAFRPVSEEADRDSGVLGYVSFLFAGVLKLNGMTVLRGADGRLTLRFPRRTARSGRSFEIFHPIRREIHEDIEARVLSQVRAQIQEILP